MWELFRKYCKRDKEQTLNLTLESIDMFTDFLKTFTNYKKEREMDNCKSGVVGTYNGVKDSGKREEMVTGSVRDTREGKGRYDLIPPYPMKRLAQHYENGAVKYGDRNWEKGQKLMRFLDSATRHLQCVLAGENDEDHESAVLWNVMGYMDTLNRINKGLLPESLDDRPKVKFDLARELREGKQENLIEHGMYMDDDDELVDICDCFCDCYCDEEDSDLTPFNLPDPMELIRRMNKQISDTQIIDLTDPEKRKYLHVVVHYDSEGTCYMVTDKFTHKSYYLNLTMKGTASKEEHVFPYEEANFLYWVIDNDGKVIGMAGSDIEVEDIEVCWGTKLALFTNMPKR